MKFANRTTAARALIPHLEKYKFQDALVLAIPRGGVVIGYELARFYRWRLNLILTKKIGHPENREYAIGAVSLYNVITTNRHPEVPQSYIHDEVCRIRNELLVRQDRFLIPRQSEAVNGKVVIIVDDGIATGFTILSAVQAIRMRNPHKVIVAVPVASPRIVNSILDVADELVVLETPVEFSGVGQFYEDFSEVTDEDVAELLLKLNA